MWRAWDRIEHDDAGNLAGSVTGSSAGREQNPRSKHRRRREGATVISGMLQYTLAVSVLFYNESVPMSIYRDLHSDP